MAGPPRQRPGRLRGWGVGAIVAADPFLRLTSKDGRITWSERSFTGDPFAVLQRLLAHYRLDHDPALPSRSRAGRWAVSATICAHHLERLPYPGTDDMAFPDLALGFYDVVAGLRSAWSRRAWILLPAAGRRRTPQARMHRVSARADQFRRLLGARGALRRGPSAARPRCRSARTSPAPAYEAAVAARGRVHPGRRHLPGQHRRSASGPSCPTASDASRLYRRLRRRNPAPFAALSRLGDVAIASASPERFLALRGRPRRDPPDQGHPAARRHARGGCPARRRAARPARRTGPRT